MHPAQQPESPRLNAGILSRLLFIWLIPLLKKGYMKTLELKDLFRILPEDRSHDLGDKLEKAWNKQILKNQLADLNPGSKATSKPGPSLTKALIEVFGAKYASYGIFAFYEECVVKVAQPICLGLLLRYFKNPDAFPSYTGFLYAGLVILLLILYTSSDHPFTFAVQHLGMKIRISLCTLIYRKALRMSKTALEQVTVGQIVNFLSSDMSRFETVMTFLHYLWVAPIQLAIVIAVLYIYVGIGWPCMSGVALILIFIPFQGLMGKAFSRLRYETASKTDHRLILMEEILSSIRVIKMYAWEEIFVDSIQLARQEEVSALRRTAYYRAINQSLFYVTSRVTLFITLLSYILIGNKLNSEIVFVSLALYGSVQLVLTLFFPAGVTSLMEVLVAISRFQEFLLLPEYERPLAITFEDGDQDGDQHALRSNNAVRLPDEDSAAKPRMNRRKVSKSRFRSKSPLPAREDAEFALPVVIDDIGGDVSLISEPRGIKLNKQVVARKICAQWNPLTKDLAFHNVSFSVNSGEILTLIGPVGAGKSSVLQSILKELPIKSGELLVQGKIGYVAQEAWIFPGTVRENILFGKEFDSKWYDEVVEACALTKDFSLLSYGDHTLLGDKGTTLSGGQKARINLARAVYSDVDVYLLDDPLSAVDMEVGAHIVNKCILGLLSSKTRILVTHQLQHLTSMSEIILLIDGWPVFLGSYVELLASNIPFTEILNRFNHPITSTSSHQVTPSVPGFQIYNSNQASSTTLFSEGMGKAPLNLEPADHYPEVFPEKNPTNRGDDVSQENYPEEGDEEVSGESLKCRLYWDYLSSGSTCFALLCIVVLAICTQITLTTSDFWLQFWIQSEENTTNVGASTRILSRIKTNRYVQIGIYSFLVLLLFLFCLLRSISFSRICMKSSTTLHQNIFYAVLRSPMSFFEENPSGRIMNRFSKDLTVIDESLPPVMFDTTEILLQTIGVIFIVSSSSPFMLIPAVIIGVLFYSIRRFYFHTARAIKRLEGVARSPVFSYITTTLHGLTTIRAFRQEASFRKRFEELMDVHSSVWYLFLASSRWLGIVVDWISILFVAAVLLNFLLENQGDAVAGLAISSAIMLTSMLQWGMRQSAELQNQMISVERIIDFCHLPSEASLESDFDRKPPESWPSTGEIKIRNLFLRFKPDAPNFVLKNINCTIYGGEKVGIVGRTGAGKSSLLSVLFRIAEPTQGFVEIDGIITSSIGLHDLRSKISIIPQEPSLFLGTIRRNLDPFDDYTDWEILQVLREVNLYEAVIDFPEGLLANINEGGSNFSTGQKQLFCLARAILRNNKILVLDEATANVDPETDSLIQKTLRTTFVNCTVITIAHRLHTVVDSDRIMVLDAGEIVEFDEPVTLLRNRQSAFYQLVQQTGKTEASNLLYIANQAAQRRRHRTSIIEE